MNFASSPHSGDLAYAFFSLQITHQRDPMAGTFPITFAPTAMPRADFRRMHSISEVMLTMMVAIDGDDNADAINVFQ